MNNRDRQGGPMAELREIPIHHRKRHKNLKLVIALLCMVLVVGVAYIGYRVGQTQKGKTVFTEQPVPTQTQPLPAVVEPPAPAMATLKGTVKNKITDQPLTGATVTIGDTVLTSDASGAFSLTTKAGTTFTDATASAQGYVSASTKTIDGMVLALVPDGKVVYVSNKNGGKKGVYTTNYDGSDEKALVPRVGDTEDYDAGVSTHDRYVTFMSTRDKRKNHYGSDDPTLYLVKIDGTGLVTISNFFGITQVQWSPVGAYVAWIGRENDDDTFSKVAVRDIDAGTTVYNGDPGDSINSYAFAKDESKFAFSVSYNPSTQSRKGIYVGDGDGKNVKKISDVSSYVTFNSDGNIEFSEYTNSKQVYYTWFHDSGVVKETARDESKRAGSISPDGITVAYIENRDGKSNVFTSKQDKSGEKQLTTIDTATGSPRWSQDGAYIIFDSNKTGESAKYIVSAQGIGAAQKVTDQLAGGYGYY